MSQNEATTTRLPESPVSIYERFTRLYDLMFRFNGYARSIENYLRENPLPLPAGARVIDAGCGTGLLTLALLRVLKRPAEITAVDLSGRSLQTARRAVRKLGADPRHKISFVRANATPGRARASKAPSIAGPQARHGPAPQNPLRPRQRALAPLP